MEESASDENIKVVVRIRDLIAREKGQPEVRSPPDLMISNIIFYCLGFPSCGLHRHCPEEQQEELDI